ncbi:MAG: hypothetical protein U9O78_03490, partial [Patescibacteria group bacterium]|nr:hypothetical protein [Patescibacteria group bacterium]
MKDTSKRLLLWIYPIDGSEKRNIPVLHLKWLLNDLTQSGRRSLVRLLEKKQLIFTDSIFDESRLSISSYGKSYLEAEFPVLRRIDDEWTGTWSVVVFMSAPKQDPRFRYLRTQLIKHNVFSLKRGVYLYPGDLPAEIFSILKEMYRSAVTVFQTDRWIFGDEQMVIGQAIDLRDRADVYSGISTEIERLIIKNHSDNSLSDKHKKQIFSIFNRLYPILGS